MKKEVAVREGLRKLPARPIYLVSTEHGGKKNVIAVGMFAIFSGNPTLVGIGVKPSRYSYSLIKNSCSFVVNVVDDRLMNAVRISGEFSGRDVDKFESANLTPEEGNKVMAPSIQESPVNIECRVVQEVKIGDHTWFIAEVKAVYVDEGYDWKRGLLFKWIGDDGFYYNVGERVAKY
jgi:flavin reductase (DIM6/NTAB) family NADH-FMN oxidoreductase RutF